MKILTIAIAKLLILIGNVLGKGTNLPGSLAMKLDKNIFDEIKFPSIRIIVTGSSGKGSTTKIINDVLVSQGYDVTYNSSGANMVGGILSTILNKCTITGKLNSDVLLLEMDERNTKFIYESINPTHVVVTNLTKDQPPRQHDVEFILSEVLRNLPKTSLVITNMDDPFMRNIELQTENKVEYYSLSENNNSYFKQIFENLNTYHCPKCGGLLEYKYYNIETLGKYKCNKCSFSHKEPSIVGYDLNLDNGTMRIGKEIVKIGGDILYNAYNTLAAFTVLNTLDLKLEIVKSVNIINKFKPSCFESKGRKYYSLSCKAENASTYNQCVYKAMCVPGLKDYVIGWKEISRRYVHFDLSWLYDVEFELLNDDNLNNIYVCGIDAENIKNRLIIAGISPEKIISSEDIPSIKDYVLSSKANTVCGILNFDYTKPFCDTFKEGE